MVFKYDPDWSPEGVDMRTKVLMAISVVILMAGPVRAADQPPLKTAKEKTGYAIGVDLVRNFKRQAIDADLAAVIRGMQEEGAGKKLQLSEPEILRTLTDYQLELKTRQAQVRPGLSPPPAACSTGSSRPVTEKGRAMTTRLPAATAAPCWTAASLTIPRAWAIR
jgi:hypothetical protein